MANIAVRVEAGCVFLSYRFQRNGAEWEHVDEPVALDTTPCNYRGEPAPVGRTDLRGRFITVGRIKSAIAKLFSECHSWQ